MLRIKSLKTWFNCSVVPAEGAAGTRSALGEIKALLRESQEKQRGVLLHVGGSTVAALVTEVGEDFVVGRSREASRIVVRLDRIDAAVLS